MTWTLLQGDCLTESDTIESGSVDLILTDPPFGTMKGAELDGWSKDKTNWDVAINPLKLFEIANRILRKNGKMVLFSQEPYTTELINEAIPNVPFCYRMIWEKDHFANSLIAKGAPVSFYEDILVFSKRHDHEALHPLRIYFKAVMEFIGLNLKQINGKLGHRRAEHTFYVTPQKAVKGEIGQKADHTFRVGSTQFSLCTEKTYRELIQTFGIDRMEGFKTFEQLRDVDQKYDSIFNLWEGKKLWDGKKYKSNILKYKKDYGGLHPTQKPILLMEDLIKTFSNEGDLVVDLTAGSGTTGEAAERTNRRSILIEKDPHYCNVIRERMSNLQQTIFSMGGITE